MFEITGDMLIGGSSVRGAAGILQAYNPAAGEALSPAFGGGSKADIDQACELAQAAFTPFRNASLDARASFLEAIAENIMALGDALIKRAHEETALPLARLEGERGRTVGQLRLFAELVRSGRFLDITIDSALPDRKPLPRPSLRLQKIPLGPVAVFCASNFPLAFSVAGGDTASALAAGCPVVVKAHSAHLGTSELVGRAIQKAVKDCGLPDGVFALVLGAGNVVGQALVAHPVIKAVGFTGSRSGGIALMKTAAQRHEPIPVYAEMSSINPFFVLPEALAKHGDTLARGFVESLTMGVGQFCTNPGLVVLLEGQHTQTFIEAAMKALHEKTSETMLTQGISTAYNVALAERLKQNGCKALAQGTENKTINAAMPALFSTSYAHFLAHPHLQDEIFGPSSLIVICSNIDELVDLSKKLEGQLTATLHLEASDIALAKRLLPILECKVGRILVNGYPTGVEVSHAMVHGGPFPATSDARMTSVGTQAIERFLRPVCYQNFPAELLPMALQDGNPLGACRLVDGCLERPL